MENRILAKNWEKIIGKKLPRSKFSVGKADWIFELLGWEKKWKKTSRMN